MKAGQITTVECMEFLKLNKNHKIVHSWNAPSGINAVVIYGIAESEIKKADYITLSLQNNVYISMNKNEMYTVIL